MAKNEDDSLHFIQNDSKLPLQFSQITDQYLTYLPQLLLKIQNLKISELSVTKL